MMDGSSVETPVTQDVLMESTSATNNVSHAQVPAPNAVPTPNALNAAQDTSS